MQPIRIKACSESDLRMLGNLARNIQRVLPVTQADIDAAAALGKGWVVWKVIEVNDPIDNLRGGTQLVIKQNSITPGQNVRRVLIVQGPGGETVVVGPGPSPLLLPDAIANSLSYVKAFGGTEQNETPTPDTPVDIVSNNGVLKVSPNMFDGIFDDGWGISSGTGAITQAAGRKSFFVKVAPTKTYTISRSAVGSSTYFWYGTYEQQPYYANQPCVSFGNMYSYLTETITVPEGANYLVVFFGMGESPNVQLELGSTATPYMPYGQIYTDGTVETINAHGKNLFNENLFLNADNWAVSGGVYTGTPNTLFALYGVSTPGFPISFKPSTQYTIKYTVSQGSGVVGSRFRVYYTDNTYTDGTSPGAGVGGTYTIRTTAGKTVSKLTFAYTQGTNDISFSNVMLEEGSTATEYAPYYDGGTATAEMLLKVGNYQDEQEILSGAVTRNIGVKVLDGTENWTNKDQYNRVSTTIGDMQNPVNPRVLIGYCNYFENLHNSEPISSVIAGQFYFAATRSAYFHIVQNTTADVKQWLADQYAAGTPVIVIYPLATPTTESVAGQTLQVTDGDNTLEITQASLSGLELEAEYTKVA